MPRKPQSALALCLLAARSAAVPSEYGRLYECRTTVSQSAGYQYQRWDILEAVTAQPLRLFVGAHDNPGDMSGNCLKDGLAADPGSVMGSGDCSGNNTGWIFDSATLQFRANSSGLCLTGKPAKPFAASQIYAMGSVYTTACATRAAVAGSGQQWSFDNATKHLKEAHSGMCLDIASNPMFTPPCDQAKGVFRTAHFCNTSLTTGERVADYLARISTADKLNQFIHYAAAMPSVSADAWGWWNEALHGVGDSPDTTWGGAASSSTSFPEPILSASSFNRSLWHSIGAAISTEGRAMHNLGRTGLTFWSPNVNIFRGTVC